jgi:hypothetical protein
MEALSSSETFVLTRPTRRNIPEGAIVHSHRRENLKSYNFTFILRVKQRVFQVVTIVHVFLPKLCRHDASRATCLNHITLFYLIMFISGEQYTL